MLSDKELEDLADEVESLEHDHSRTLDRLDALSWSRVFRILDKTGSIPARRLG